MSTIVHSTKYGYKLLLFVIVLIRLNKSKRPKTSKNICYMLLNGNNNKKLHVKLSEARPWKLATTVENVIVFFLFFGWRKHKKNK